MVEAQDIATASDAVDLTPRQRERETPGHNR